MEVEDKEMQAAMEMAAQDLEAAKLPKVKPCGAGAWVLAREPRYNLLDCKRKYESDIRSAAKKQREAFIAIKDEASKEEYYAASKAMYAAEMRFAGFCDAIKEGIRPCGDEVVQTPSLHWDVVALYNPPSEDDE